MRWQVENKSWDMMMTDPKDSFVDDLFAQARNEAVTPSDDLMARVLSDASAAMPTAVSLQPNATSGMFAGLLEVIGGWSVLSGVAAAGVAGLWVGLAPPDAVESWAADILGTTTQITLMPDFDEFDFSETLDG